MDARLRERNTRWTSPPASPSWARRLCCEGRRFDMFAVPVIIFLIAVVVAAGVLASVHRDPR